MILSRRLLLVTMVALVVSAVVELSFVEHRHRIFPGSDITLFWTAFGSAACIVIVLVSKWFGHTFVMRHEDPYTGEPVQDELSESDHG
jgi:hypothetical protein